MANGISSLEKIAAENRSKLAALEATVPGLLEQLVAVEEALASDIASGDYDAYKTNFAKKNSIEAELSFANERASVLLKNILPGKTISDVGKAVNGELEASQKVLDKAFKEYLDSINATVASYKNYLLKLADSNALNSRVENLLPDLPVNRIGDRYENISEIHFCKGTSVDEDVVNAKTAIHNGMIAAHREVYD